MSRSELAVPEGLLREHFLEAFATYARSGLPEGFRPSTKFVVVFEGAEYPPPAIAALAIEQRTGGLPGPGFRAGEGTRCFKAIRDAGFEIVQLDELELDLRSILERTNTTETLNLVQARVGQGVFRRRVLDAWDDRCCVTGSRTLSAIRASHIRPWRDSSDEQRLSPDNGLPLLGTLDALFDAGLISFAFDGEMIVSDELDPGEAEILGTVERRLLEPPPPLMAENLAYHRENVFQGT